MKFIYKAIRFVLFAFVIYGCSADYLDKKANSLSSINLKANVETNSIGIDQTLELKVEGNDGLDYTAQSELFINGEPLQNNIVEFEEGGEYTFTASFQELSSNQLVLNVVSEKFIVIDKAKVLREQTVNFQLINPDGTDATNEAEFYVNNTLIDNASFTSAKVGAYTVYATFDNGVSQTQEQSFEIFIPKRKVVYEDYTGAWCGWCVRVTNAINLIAAQTDDVVFMAIHNNDPMSFTDESQLADEFGVTGYPAAKVNRTQTVPSNEDSQESIDFALTHAGEDTNLSIAIDTNLNGDVLNYQVQVVSENNIPGSYKLVVYLYQDGLIFPQTNYYVNTPGSPYYQMGNPIVDFVHDHVLEASLSSNIFGDPIPATAALQTYSASFEPINLSEFAENETPNSYDPTRFGISVYVVDENNNALNAQHVKAGQSVNFE